MKKKDLILAGSFLCVALLAWIFLWGTKTGEKYTIRITVDGEVYGEYSLEEPQVIEIGTTNICEIKDGKAKMIQADCPDQLCVHQKALDGTGGTSLEEPQVIEIGTTNICEIKDGKAKMIQADCPDQLCVHQKALDGTGGTIVCLPNRVVIEETGTSDTKPQDVVAFGRRQEKEENIDA